MIQCIQEAVQGLMKIKGENIVIAIGNSGSGKSTMRTSLIYGPDKLEEKFNDNKRRLVEQKEEFKNQGILKIGHSAAKSETFRPEIVYSKEL